MKRAAILVAAFAGLVAAGCRVDSSAPITGGQDRFILRGKVTNLAGTTALTGVTVQVQPFGGPTAGAVIRLMQTDASGIYRTFGLAPGIYSVAVVMGDSSRITASGRADTVYVGVSADSTIVRTLTYDPGKVISGTLTWTFQDTLRSVSIALGGVKVRLFQRTAAGPPEVYTVIDSQFTSATGALRFAVRPTATGVFRLQFDTTGFRAKVDTAIAGSAIVDTVRVTGATSPSGATASATGTATLAPSGPTYRAPYQVRARIFKDKNNDGVFTSGTDSVVSGVRVWLRKAGGTVNLGSGTFTTGTSTAATGNLTIGAGTATTGLHSNAANGWALHVLTWYLPTGCSLVNGNDVTATGDVVGGTVATKDLPLKCS